MFLRRPRVLSVGGVTMSVIGLLRSISRQKARQRSCSSRSRRAAFRRELRIEALESRLQLSVALSLSEPHLVEDTCVPVDREAAEVSITEGLGERDLAGTTLTKVEPTLSKTRIASRLSAAGILSARDLTAVTKLLAEARTILQNQVAADSPAVCYPVESAIATGVAETLAPEPLVSSDSGGPSSPDLVQAPETATPADDPSTDQVALVADGETDDGTFDAGMDWEITEDSGDATLPDPEEAETEPTENTWTEPGDPIENPIVNEPIEQLTDPVITSFTATPSAMGDVWVLQGTVVHPMPWTLTIVFGGLLAGESTSVNTDGTFYCSFPLPPDAIGTVTAQAIGPDGAGSNVWPLPL